ncbi:MAG TPA: efflux RND transporter periplasmic adaptor subunit [Bryobacteraceae bacterium]|nr:efflux RND transporter periplasmic adaptor subunit [Bryobacteraceae bacterium]
MQPPSPHTAPNLLAFLAVFLLTIFAAGCRQQETARAAPPPEVQVVPVELRDVPVFQEWIGTLDGRVNAEIRGQVTGYLLKQDYREGAFVRKGQLLFEIDPRPFQAVLNQAQGNLAQANGNLQQAIANLAQSRARLGKAELDVKRYTPLVKTRAISQEEMDNANQSRLEAQAGVEAAQAGIEAARAGIAAAKAAVYDAEVKLGFTRITSPVDGIAGLAKVQVGDLVSPSGGVLTTVSTVDPIKAYFTVSEQEYLARYRDYQVGEPRRSAHGLELILADGSVYGQKGTFFMADRQVDIGTGALRIAALFPNPGNILRPGQYCRVRAMVNFHKNAVLVPQRAVSELQGTFQVATVGDDNKVTIRKVRLGDRSGNSWVVEEGVQAGERVIVEGIQKVRTGSTVNPKPAAIQMGAR